jgi:hypothetical protein
MLLWDPAYRPTAKDCLNHPYFADLRAASQVIERRAELESTTNYITQGPT